MTPTFLRVNLGARSYDIVVAHQEIGGPGAFARPLVQGNKAFIVTDANVEKHGRSVAASLKRVGLESDLAVLPAGEGQKSLAVAAELYDRLVACHADRQTLMAAVGGGVIGDLSGFVAATFNRGLPLLMVPTTLLAMVDSSVGGKVAVNHPRGKNLIGTFHQPKGVWIDSAVLDTLPEREYRSGLAEVVKYGVILDPEFFAYLEANAAAILRKDPAVMPYIILRCCRLKADIVERDEREESGLRAVLNYGHTFAHAFETAAGYGTWLHGEAVAAGMICASRLAERHGLIPSSITDRQRKLLQAFHLPTAPDAWPIDQLLETMRSDKKSLAGKMRFVLPKRLGEVALFDDVPEVEVRQVLEEIRE